MYSITEFLDIIQTENKLHHLLKHKKAEQLVQ